MEVITKSIDTYYPDGHNWGVPSEHSGFSSNDIGFLHMRYKADGILHRGCVLIWKYPNYFKFEENGVLYKAETHAEIIKMAKAYLVDILNPFQSIQDQISELIDNRINAMSHKMDLRIAQFRGYLFSQTLQLRS